MVAVEETALAKADWKKRNLVILIPKLWDKLSAFLLLYCVFFTMHNVLLPSWIKVSIMIDYHYSSWSNIFIFILILHNDKSVFEAYINLLNGCKMDSISIRKRKGLPDSCPWTHNISPDIYHGCSLVDMHQYYGCYGLYIGLVYYALW